MYWNLFNCKNSSNEITVTCSKALLWDQGIKIKSKNPPKIISQRKVCISLKDDGLHLSKYEKLATRHVSGLFPRELNI